MSDVTQKDRERRSQLLKLIDCMGDENEVYAIDKALSAHRMAAEKAVLDRLKEADAVAVSERICRKFGGLEFIHLNPTNGRHELAYIRDDKYVRLDVTAIVQAAIADALETKR